MLNQKSKNKFYDKIAECAGLWLAEGDNKCNNEITFTNNEFSLVQFFHHNIKELFSNYVFRIRIYVYTPTKENIVVPLEVDRINRYIDKRATKPYYIWRLASVKLNKKWKDVVSFYKNNPQYYPPILRGFFAGEGSIKSTSHNSRSITISQKKDLFLEKLLNLLNIEFAYRPENRTYSITHKYNWDKLAKIKLADLHPIKKDKFWKVYNEFKEEHYKDHYIRDNVFKLLIKPYSSARLAIMFNRSQARIQDILIDLKKKKIVNNFRVGSKGYWIRNDQDTIIISKLKKRYLDLLDKGGNTTKEIAKYFKVNDRSAFRRLKELEKLGLVKRKEDKEWIKEKTRKKVIFYDFDIGY